MSLPPERNTYQLRPADFPRLLNALAEVEERIKGRQKVTGTRPNVSSPDAVRAKVQAKTVEREDIGYLLNALGLLGSTLKLQMQRAPRDGVEMFETELRAVETLYHRLAMFTLSAEPDWSSELAFQWPFGRHA